MSQGLMPILTSNLSEPKSLRNAPERRSESPEEGCASGQSRLVNTKGKQSVTQHKHMLVSQMASICRALGLLGSESDRQLNGLRRRNREHTDTQHEPKGSTRGIIFLATSRNLATDTPSFVRKALVAFL